jgi:inorganic pyrophosphatase
VDADPWSGVPARARVRIEIPRGTFTKRRSDGSVDFVSPLPSPFNYGSVLGTLAPDGDALDALVLGPRLPAGQVVSVPVWAVYAFVDAGVLDPKLVCAERPLTRGDRLAVAAFFTVYARLKRVVAWRRGSGAPTRALGFARRGTDGRTEI